MSKIVCPVCRKQCLKSKVLVLGRMKTLIGFSSFYDESGKEHVHDPNTVTFWHKCSNGHVWTVKGKKKCWCGWPNKEDEIIIH